MRWRLGAITALLALACALSTACGGGKGGSTIIATTPAFPQGFLPVLLAGSGGGSGDVAFRFAGDLYAVSGTSDVTVVSRTTGSAATFVHVSGNPSLLSIAPGVGDDGRLFAGDSDGRIWAIASDGSTAALLLDTGAQPITGLAFAPSGFGGLGGSLLAAAGTSGVLRITVGDTPTVAPFASTGKRFADLVFAGTTLFALEAIDATHGQIDSISGGGTVTAFQAGFVAPVGIAFEGAASELYVADAGDDVLKTVPVAGGAPTRRARYDFDPAANGIAWDGIGALAFLTSGPLAIRGANLPRLDPANTNYGLIFNGPTVGYGDLEFDRLGGFLADANDDDDPNDPADSMQNYLFNATRDGSVATAITTGVGVPGEDLLGMALDPISNAIYLGTRAGNVYQRTSDGTVTFLVSITSGVPVLGLERVPKKRFDPFGFDPYSGQLVATTQDGNVYVIDPQSATFTKITATPIGSRLSDLVFSANGTLYVVDNGPTTSRILRVAPNGTATNLQAPPSPLGLPDGIEIDEGGQRLFVASQTAGGGQLLAVSLGSIPATVTALANFSIDDGFFPTGVVYDGLGAVMLRQGNNSTSLHAVSVSP
jgi:hypothetical protein